MIGDDVEFNKYLKLHINIEKFQFPILILINIQQHEKSSMICVKVSIIIDS